MELFPQPDFNSPAGLMMGGCSLALVFESPAFTPALCRATACSPIAVDDVLHIVGHCAHFDGPAIHVEHNSTFIGAIGEAGDFEFTYTAEHASPFIRLCVPDGGAKHVITRFSVERED